MKSNIAFILPDFSVGGAEQMVALLSSNLNFDVYNVYIIVLRKKLNNHIEDSISKNIKIIYLNKDYGFSLKTMFLVNKYLRKIKPIIIHSHLQSFAYLSIFLIFHKTKCIHTIHNKPINESKGFRRKLLYFFIKTKKIIPVGISIQISKEIIDVYKCKNVETIYNPVKLTNDKQYEKNRHTSFRIISIGRLCEQKNQEQLILIMKELVKKYDVNLHIVGDGEKKEYLQNLIYKNKLEKVVFLNGYSNNVKMNLKEADLFLLTSIYEGLPMTLLESLSCGVPAICSNVGGIKDVLKDENFLVNNPNNTQEYVKKIERIFLLSKKEYSELSKSCILLVEPYDISVIAKKYELLYEKYGRRNK